MDKEVSAAEDEAQSYMMSEKVAILFVFVSTLIITFGFLFKVWPMLVFFAIWLSHFYYKQQFTITIRPAMIPGLLFLALCLFSTFWAFDKGYALYNSVQFASYFVCLMIISRIVSLEHLITGLAFGFGTIMIITLLSNNYDTVFATGQKSLIGYFGSKNVVGSYAAIGTMIGFSLLIWGKNLKLKILHLSLFLISILCLYLSKSITSTLAAALTIGICLAVYFVCKLPSGLRLLIFTISASAAVSFYLILYAAGIDLYAEILNFFNKSPNLTGRTWLWSEGIEQFKENFWLGYGYKTFWVEGNGHAEFYWDIFDFEGKGFSFHNLYIEAGVQLGILGFLIILLLVVSAFARAMYLSFKHGMDLQLSFILSMTVLQVIRSMTEVNLMGPFGVGFFIFFILYFKMWSYNPVRASMNS